MIIIENINNNLYRNIKTIHFLTAFLAVFDIRKNIVRYVKAAHIPALFYRKNKVELLSANGHFLGLFNDTNYEERELKLEKGDRFFLYTDGITDIHNTDHEFFTEQRLAEIERLLGRP